MGRGQRAFGVWVTVAAASTVGAACSVDTAGRGSREPKIIEFGGSGRYDDPDRDPDVERADDEGRFERSPRIDGGPSVDHDPPVDAGNDTDDGGPTDPDDSPDASEPAADGGPAERCGTIVIPAYDGPLCPTSYAECLASCRNPHCVEGCWNELPPDDQTACRGCFDQSTTACVNELGCQWAWDRVQCCASDHCDVGDGECRAAVLTAECARDWSRFVDCFRLFEVDCASAADRCFE